MDFGNFLSSSWLVLSLSATGIWAAVNVVDKFVVSKVIKKWQVALALSGAVSFASIAALLALGRVAVPGIADIALLLLFGVVWIVGIAFYYLALKEEEVSRVIPIFLLDPIFTAILAASFLGEIFAPQKYLGIALLVAGAALVSVRDLKAPRLEKGFFYALAATLLFAVSSLILKLVLARVDFLSAFFWGRVGMLFAVLPLALIYRKECVKTIGESKVSVAIFIAGALASVVAGIFYTRAIELGFLTIVSAVYALQPLFVLAIVVALSVLRPQLLKEEIGANTLGIKIVAIIAMMAGTYLAVS